MGWTALQRLDACDSDREAETRRAGCSGFVEMSSPIGATSLGGVDRVLGGSGVASNETGDPTSAAGNASERSGSADFRIAVSGGNRSWAECRSD